MRSVADILGHDAGRARRQTGKVETRSDLWAVFRLMEMACCPCRGDLGIENGNQADPLLLEELYIVPRKLWLFQSFNRQGFAGSSSFFPGQNLLEPKSPHLPRSNSYGLGLRV